MKDGDILFVRVKNGVIQRAYRTEAEAQKYGGVIERRVWRPRELGSTPARNEPKGGEKVENC